LASQRPDFGPVHHDFAEKADDDAPHRSPYRGRFLFSAYRRDRFLDA
jgi:hypothetical protein